MFSTQNIDNSNSRTATYLKSLGKTASDLYQRGVPLTDAVIKVVAKDQGLNDEHVRRVVEFTNNYAFDDEYKKLAGNHRVVDFDNGPADPSVIVREFREIRSTNGGGGANIPLNAMNKVAYVQGIDGVEMLFSNIAPVKIKTAAVKNNSFNVNRTLQDLFALKSKLASDYITITNKYISDSDSLCKEARKLLLEGNSTADLFDIIKVASAEDNSKVKLLTSCISKRLQNDTGLLTANIKTASAKSYNSKMVNPNSQFYKICDSFIKTAEQHFNYSAALELVDGKIQEIKKLLSAKGI